MHVRISLCAFFVLFLTSGLILGQDDGMERLGGTFTIQSTTLQEERTYTVQLPLSYPGDAYYHEKHYPVMVLLDGPRLLPLAGQVVHSLSQPSVEKIPEMIIVSVHNTDRNRDMIPIHTQLEEGNGTRNFRDFLVQELLAEIDQRYRTLNSRLLVGHSHAGLFVLNAFLHQAPFQAYLAIDPNFLNDDQGLNRLIKALAEDDDLLKGQVYIAKADNPFQPGFKETPIGLATQQFEKVLQSQSHQEMRSKTAWFEEEDHFSVPLIALYQGLRFLYQDYQYPLDQILDMTPESLREHYAKLSRDLGQGILPPAKVLHQISEFLDRSQGKPELAKTILDYLVDAYPNAHPLIIGLGELYAQAGQTQKARQHFTRALQLDPENEYALDGIQALKNE